MHWRKVLIATLAGGLLLTLFALVFTVVANAVAPFNIFQIGGMRPPEDPILMLYYVSPFVLAFLSAMVFDTVEKVLEGPPLRRGIRFGLILLAINMIPSLFVIYSSMRYPAGFYIANILAGVIGFPLLGSLYAWIWARNR